MNGPEHYAEAEALLGRANAQIEVATPNTISAVSEMVAHAFAAAQIHATLALAAAAFEAGDLAATVAGGAQTANTVAWQAALS